MNRRQFLGGLGATTMVSIAGCSEGLSASEATKPTSSDSGSQTSTTTTTTPVLGSKDSPWSGYIAHLSGGASVDVRDLFDSPVFAVLTGNEIQSVFVKAESGDVIVDAVENSDYNLESIVSTRWEHGAVCALKSRFQLPQELSQGEVESAFPNAISIAQIAFPGEGRSWLVYSRLQSEAEIENRLGELGVEMESVAPYVYNKCDRINSQE